MKESCRKTVNINTDIRQYCIMKPTVRFNTPYTEDGDDDSGVQRRDIPTHADGLEYGESYEERRSALVYFLSDVVSRTVG